MGQIKWAYYTAAAINGYTVTRDENQQWSLRATVVMADSFKLSQRPLVFVAPHEKGDWRWPIEEIDISNGAVVAKLGQPLP